MPDNKDRKSKLDSFLAKNTIQQLEGLLPVVHSTKSYNIEELIEASGLKAAKCKYFGEDLIYFFLGRPAYRTTDTLSEPQHWELPTCFVFDDISKIPVKRVFPFDSGAFKAGRYPSYIDGMPQIAFEVAGGDAPGRIVSAFFGSFERYVKGEARTRAELEAEHSLGPLDAEVLAVQKLAIDGTPANFDDRRFSVEVQVGQDIDLNSNPPDAIILPTEYLKDKKVRGKLEAWDCEILNYETYSLNLSLYYGIIFEKFAEYCKSKGIL